MSKLGKTLIALPNGVELKVALNRSLTVKGPKGSLHLDLPQGIGLKVENSFVSVQSDEDLVSSKAVHGLYWSLIRNCILGVTEGFERKLSLIGVGYRAAVVGNQLDLQVGYSHPTALKIPSGLQILVDKGTAISVKGMDKHQVGQFAAAIRAIKPPEPYKGKGIRYDGEFVRKKEGKAAKGK